MSSSSGHNGIINRQNGLSKKTGNLNPRLTVPKETKN